MIMICAGIPSKNNCHQLYCRAVKYTEQMMPHTKPEIMYRFHERSPHTELSTNSVISETGIAYMKISQLT